MKKPSSSTLCPLVLSGLTALMLSGRPARSAMTSENGTTIVNTTTLSQHVTGYVSTTPLKIFIKKNRVVKIEALKNEETPKYFARVKKHLLDKWNGKKVADALKMQVDGVSGATYSSDAVKENVRIGLEYYRQNR